MGVDVAMVTGDNELVARNVAQHVGIKSEYLFLAKPLFFFFWHLFFFFFILLEMYFFKFHQKEKLR
jgi:magnesium-transporting ATPase (P-type)